MEDIEEIKELLKLMDRNRIHGKPTMWMWRTLELTDLAYEHGQGGLLPTVEECARHLKINRKAMAKTLHLFNKCGIVHETPQGWVVDRFQERPVPAEGVKPIRYYARKRHATAAQRREKGDGAPKEAIPYYE